MLKFLFKSKKLVNFKNNKFFIISFLSLCLIVSALFIVNYQPDNSIKAIKERGVLLVGTTGDYRPLSFYNKDTNAYEGFDIDLAEDLAEALNVKAVFVRTSWQNLMQDTVNKKFDAALSGITITEERKQKALMSKGYLNNGKTVLCRIEDADKYINLDAVNKPNVRIMENPGGLNEQFARENLPEAKLIIHNINEEIPGLIAQGKADVMITDVIEALYYSDKNPRLAAPIAKSPFTYSQKGILIHKENKALAGFVNNFLEQESKNGRLDELKKTYKLN